MTLIELALLLLLGSLGLMVIRQDLAALEIRADLVLGLSVLAALVGILFPLSGNTPDDALLGAAIGLALGTLTRVYAHWRAGTPGFGGADIALLAGGAGLLGPGLLGPWVLVSAGLAILGSAILPKLGFRATDLDGVEVRVVPFCPALILGAALIFSLARSGIVPASGLL